MKTYIVQRMTGLDYHRMMTGDMNYHVDNIKVEAETKEEAIEKAKKGGYIVNEGYVKTAEEIAEKERREREEEKAELAKEEARKAKRLETEKRKAEEAGLTVEEYRKEKARKAHIKRLEREIAELERELKNKKAYLEKLKG